MTINASTLYRDTRNLMRDIDQEVNRPEEDAVPQFIGNSSRKCIENYLIGFLDENGKIPQQPGNLNSLLVQCQTIDPRFLSIDISSTPCLSDIDIDDLNQVRKCYEVAQQIQQLVQSSAANRL